MSVRVVKIGGAALADASWLEAFAASAASSAEPYVIVHGGGPEISALSAQLGIEVEWVQGRRMTPPAALDVASMVLNGRINKRIVSALLDAGIDALGLSGVDGALVQADVAEGGALGCVGKVTHVRAELLERLLNAGMVPVIAPISRGPAGSQLNVNADEVAAAIAVALNARELLFVTDVAGVRDAAGLTCASLSIVDAHAFLADGVAAGGMAVKLRAALDALASGVAQVRVGGVSSLADTLAGTVIVPAIAEVAA